ncbi:MAG: CDP-alcohol phosphatidyltransferase family protein [Anaerolineales bacterium]|nr:MAG: CDP-alcohol phosphatidyltransferase family protein [Anaerolineales bacterium]
MKDKTYFIVSPTWVDWLTLGSLLLASLGLYSAFHGRLTLAISLMLLAMFVDMLDGFLARRMNLESEFGRQLDGFCDMLTYLLLPLFILYQFGMRDWLSLSALFVFLVSGILRLSRFNIVGMVEERGVAYHIGLQVIWSQLLVVLAFPLWMWLGALARYPLIVLLFGMSFFMIRNLKFPKPIWYRLQTAIILSVAALYFALYVLGIHVP